MNRSVYQRLAMGVLLSVVAVLAFVGVVQALGDPDRAYVQATPGATRMGPGMMGSNPGQGVYTNTLPYHGYGMGPGMMGGGMMAMMGMMGGGMGGMMQPGGMMGHVASPSLLGIEPLSLADAQAAVEDYLAGLGNEVLALAEVMIFDNQAYAEVIERSTGVGAFEVLIDPITLAVLPEPGPNMMWNTKYGHMAGLDMMGMMQPGGMMGSQPEASAEMPVGADEAIETAQRYLDAYLPGATAAEDAEAFYGYYTIHILRGGKIVGMLGVNGTSRQVLVHTWHGDFIEMGEEQE